MVRTLLLALLAVVAVAERGVAQSCNLNGVGPDALVLTVPDVGSDFDLGWKGRYHDLHVPGGARFELCLSGCDTATDPLCDVAGYAGGQSAAGRAFAPPIPIAAGSFAACVVTTFQEPFATGSASLETGAIDVAANVSADLYVTALATVCPVCTGTNAGDSGTCVGGADAGAACVTDDVVTVQNATGGNPYRVSRDCLPSGTPVSTAFSMTFTTGISTVAALCAAQTSDDDCVAGSCGAGNCTGPGNGSGLSQNCCTSNTSRRCFPYPLARTGAAAAPAPAWPDPGYPKLASETIVSAFCAPGAPGIPGLLVNAEVGLPGPAAFVLPVDAEWLLDPTPVTTTTTTSPSTSTTVGSTSTTVGSTTTTLAPACATGAECDDGDACTEDACRAGACVNAPLGGAAGTACRAAAVLDDPACPADAKLRSALGKLLANVRRSLDASASATPRKARRLRRAADAALKAALKKVAKAAKKGAIDGPCRDALTEALGALRREIASLGS